MKRSIYISVGLFLSLFSASAQPDAVREHIRSQMPLSTRTRQIDSSCHIALPYPFSVPQAKGSTFMDMFYWDSYFTNLGLLSLGDLEQAKNNTDNILYLIEKYGYMPNASNTGLLNRSQPPYASMMVRDIYERTADRDWLEGAVKTLEKEYAWWMSERITPNGLNRHFNSANEQELLDFFAYLAQDRFPKLREKPLDREQKLRIASNYLSEAEGGWDFNPRFDGRCEEFNPLDLNSNLYIYEQNFAYFYRELGKDGARDWEQKAKERKKLIQKFLFDNKSGLFYDWNYVDGTHSQVYSSAVFNALWAGILSRKQARTLVDNLDRLECQYAVTACEEHDSDLVYQWDRPNAWASFNVLAVMGLDKYGYKKQAQRIALKYIHSISGIYGKTGQLWEKFNALTADIDVKDEYAMPGDFMGWTAGAFLFCYDYTKQFKQ